ncbi:TetR/AcrR family transcriptional regulator [Seohaeicola sp. SP36]|jgi:AcrR family transcriptional regulator|uniref:TetR/AcrR family transcriptional regulator n=1 Tax=unclassified Seohaeicola TaxID=2641111 RepID=UPI00237BB875|nr:MULTISPECIES: TetR/AcrR family transcriptional regulator [unclassified Seohaeicola]MDD9708348.1 TetR/AcrR family transcriptional regulator [Seohaeicola sp. 4SK31]MDD9736497.1 TetR/AcrR family transcriptional regulator [Seohaeicola sp. SP36]MDF1707110.1 TetR/AcrR family transcriptional regulator [Paracoccaceae bacterium]HSG55990.1 TetR/AcrR family transcriptional regulator [Paracoccaceae bacterium]
MDKRARLTRSDWLMAGLAALAEAGPVALKAEPMARRLGTTKGSFYWHFADVPDFHLQMLELWAGGAVEHIPAALADQPTAVAKLRRLGQIVAGSQHPVLGDVPVEPAIRAWAREDARVAETLAAVDRARIAFIQGLLTEVEITNPEMARIIYAAHVGMQDLTARDGIDNASPMGSLVDLVLALR